MTDVLGCSTCTKNCCKREGRSPVIHVLRREIDKTSQSNEIVVMPLANNQCEHLTPDLKCGIYDTRHIVCRTYPLSMDNEYNLYLATTCPSYTKIIDGIMNNDKDTIDWVKKTKSYIIQNTPTSMLNQWTSNQENNLLSIKVNI